LLDFSEPQFIACENGIEKSVLSSSEDYCVTQMDNGCQISLNIQLITQTSGLIFLRDKNKLENHFVVVLFIGVKNKIKHLTIQPCLTICF
jgi:hypothetical protein